MRDKLVAGLVTAAIVAPLCAVCILGPALLASVFAGIAGWRGGFDPVVTTGLVLAAGIAVYGIFLWGRERHSPVSPRKEVGHER